MPSPIAQVRFADLTRALCRAPVLAFFAESVVFGAGMTVVERLLFVYLIRDLGGSVTLAGASVACTVVLELPIFYYAQWLLKHVGHHALICCSMCAYFTRVYGYTLLTPATVNYILALESLHGITFASYWISAVDHVKTISPPAFVSSFQTLLQVCLACIGGGVGAFVGGWAMDVYGGKAMYRFTSLTVAALFVLRVLGVAVARACGVCRANDDTAGDSGDYSTDYRSVSSTTGGDDVTGVPPPLTQDTHLLAPSAAALEATSPVQRKSRYGAT